MIGGVWAARFATNLNAWTQMQGTDNFHAWAFQHIKSGYPDLQTLLDRLRTLEAINYRDAFVIANSVETELDNMLKTFPDLSPLGSADQDYYRRDQVLHAIFELDFVLTTTVARDGTDKKSLRFAGGKEIASGTTSTIERLLDEIEKLRARHQADLEKLWANAEEDKQLILTIKKKATEIVQEDIEYLERLKGECALCKRFS
jgi:hypothetical protein